MTKEYAILVIETGEYLYRKPNGCLMSKLNNSNPYYCTLATYKKSQTANNVFTSGRQSIYIGERIIRLNMANKPLFVVVEINV